MKMHQFLKWCSMPLLAVSAMLPVWTPGVNAQIEKTLKFIPGSVDFGIIREEGGKVSRKVKAVNVSPDSTYIISARTSCGCSAVEYSEAMLAPGDTAVVTLTYDPLNRPGRFLKTARFFTGKERIGNSIKLSGAVIPSSKSLDMSYPDRAGQLRLSTLFVNAGEISRKEARPLFVGIYNDSDTQLALSAVTESDTLDAGLAPDTIEPFGIATLSLMLRGRNIPVNENELLYVASLINTVTGDTIARIPVGGTVR